MTAIESRMLVLETHTHTHTLRSTPRVADTYVETRGLDLWMFKLCFFP